ncbi:MAG: hypothetical protein HKN76_06075 [Saprospiraceae bacterium]|nr:hypothetical protein [Saprospiraceae bacterium]
MKRYIAAFRILTFGFLIMGFSAPVGAICKMAKVGYSLPDCPNFNISLIDAIASDVDPMTGSKGIKKVVLDAGHGGKDEGCSGRNSKEKDIALDITLRVGQLIKRHHPDVEVIYTRNKDEFVPLHERASIANKNKADLFISIHCNTTAKKNSAIGTETFVMGLHRAEDNLMVAKRENSVIEHEHDYEKHYEGYDPNSDEGHITLSMYQNAFLDQSIMLANLIESEFKSHGQRVSRGVKQAGFLVLRNTVMPSVLIEAGFLNHNKEESILTSEEGKDRAAASIFNAFTKYKYDMDKMVASQSLSTIEAIPASHTIHNEPTSSDKIASASANEEEPAVNYVERAKREMERMKKDKSGKADMEKPAAVSVVKSETKEERTTSTASKPVISTKEEKQDVPASPGIKPREKKLEYVVQLSASTKKIRQAGGKWNEVENLMIRFENNMYKYQVGTIESYEAAVKTKERLRKMGFNDCFVVAYYNDQPIKVKDALAMSN